MFNIPAQDLAQHLVTHQLLTPDTAKEVIQTAALSKQGIISYLVDQAKVQPTKLAFAIAQAYGLPLLDLDVMDVTQLPLQIMTEQLIQQHHSIPLWQRGQHLFIALADPPHFQGLEAIQFHTALHIHPVLVELHKLRHLLNHIDSTEGLSTHALLNNALSMMTVEESSADQSTSDTNIDDTPLVRYVNHILLEAIQASASDIHFEPYEHNYRIRFRLDGILHDKAAPPTPIASRLASRLKVMARLNIAERRVPQDGRLRFSANKEHSVEFRVNTCPTLYGEKIVLRLLNLSTTTLAIEHLGLETTQLDLLTTALRQSHGMVLATGPTGSGKTVTLYTALNQLNHSTVNISTVEDPVEIPLPGINQVNVNTKTGLNFASALRAFLRQDPDILMVGEMRDLETAEIGIKAAQTGHLVLSTLHTHDVSQSLVRLTYMGIPVFNIATSINLIIAQRLVRCLCTYCKQVDTLGTDMLHNAGFAMADIATNMTLYRANGCDQCTQGYQGRTGIFEVVPINDALGHLLISGADTLQIRDHIRQEIPLDLRMAGLNKVKAGITSLAEVNRVIQT